jgi:uncharacterized protein YfkK (UPF0435 family)
MRQRVRTMNLEVKSVENVEYMIEKVKEKLKVMNLGAIKPSHFDENMYEELKEIYELVMKKDAFSPNEMQALVEELGNLKK